MFVKMCHLVSKLSAAGRWSLCWVIPTSIPPMIRGFPDDSVAKLEIEKLLTLWFDFSICLEDHTMFYNNVCYFMTYHVHKCIRKYITSMLALCYRIQHVHLTITCITIKWVSQYVTICISRSRSRENARGCTTEEGMTQWKVTIFTKTHCIPSSNCLWAQSTTNREGGD